MPQDFSHRADYKTSPRVEVIILLRLRIFFSPTFLSRKLELAKGNIQTGMLMKARSRNVNWGWWCTPVIPALEKGVQKIAVSLRPP